MLMRFFASLRGKSSMPRARVAKTAEAMFQEALAHFRRLEYEQAEAICEDLLELQPQSLPAMDLRALIAGQTGDVDRMEQITREILVLTPGEPSVHYKLGLALRTKGRCHEAITSFRQALALDPGYEQAHSALLFCMSFSHGPTAAEIFAEYLQFSERFETPVCAHRKEHTNQPDVARALRIGYVAFDFGYRINHYHLEALLQAHDRSRFKLFLYDNRNRETATTAALKQPGDSWRTLAGLDDEQAAARIRADAIDILVDLSGHLNNNRLLTFARKPAPVQMTWLSYPQTTGIRAIDYRVTDRYCDPPGLADRYYVEQLLRLPDAYWCYCPPRESPGPLPAIRNGFVTFGCFNTFAKITPPTLELFAKVLQRNARSRLIMLCVPQGESTRRVRETFERHGIAAERLSIHPRQAYVIYRRMHRQVDIALDPFPCNGATTTMDALWMGVPVVSLEGESCAGRAGVSILTVAGMQQFIAGDTSHYIDIATRLTTDLPQLAAMRAELPTKLAASPLADGPRFARGMEALYREAWTKWCKSRQA
jgi:protein O-GlcNAc transferase